MSTGVSFPNCDVAIMARIVDPERGDLPLAAARAFLKFDFEKSDHDALRVLSQRANAGGAYMRPSKPRWTITNAWGTCLA